MKLAIAFAASSLLLFVSATGQARPARSTKAQRKRDFDRQRQLAARVSGILHRRAPALPASIKKAPLKLVDRSEAHAEKLVSATKRPWIDHDMSTRLRKGHDMVWLSSASGKHTLRLRFGSERLVRGSVPEAPSMAEMHFSVERQNPLAKARGVINELEKRFDIRMNRVEVYTGGQYDGEQPWRKGPGSVVLTKAWVHKSGLQRSLVKEARVQSGGAWLLQTSYTAHRRNPVTGQYIEQVGAEKKHYDLFVPDSERKRLSFEEGTRRWNLIDHVRVNPKGKIWDTGALNDIGIQVITPSKGRQAGGTYLRRSKTFNPQVAKQSGRSYAGQCFSHDVITHYPDDVTWQPGHQAKDGSGYVRADLQGGVPHPRAD